MRHLSKLIASFVVSVALAAGIGLPPAPAEAQTQTQAQTQAPQAAPPPQAPTTETAPAAQQPPPLPAAAPPVTLPPEALEPVERLSRNIETAEKSIQQLKELEGELQRLRGEVERIIYNSTATADNLRPQLEEVDKQIQRLGPPPGKDQPAESATVAAERQRLNSLKAQFDGAIKTTELAWVRAKQLIDRITVIRYQMFARNLFERRDSPLLPGVWRNVAEQWPMVMGRLQYYGGDWLGWAKLERNWLMVLGGAIVASYLILSVMVRTFIRRRLVRPEPPPTFFDRTIKAAWVAPLRALAPAVAVLMLYFGLAALDLLFSPWIGLAGVTLAGLLVFIAASALLRVGLAPRRPAWRLVPVADRTARRVLFILEAFVGCYVLDTILVELGRALYVPLYLTVVQSFLLSVAFAIFLAALFVTPIVPQTGPDRPVNGHEFVPGPVGLLTPVWFKLPLLATLALILGASLLGYIALGRFVAHQVVLTGTVLAGCFLLYLAVRSATRGRADNRDLVGTFLERRFGLSDPVRRRQISRLVEVIGTLVIAILALPLLMLQWGFSGDDIRDWSKAALFGFEVGQFHISLARILIGMGLFTGLLFTTRLLQRWLRDKVMTQARIDPGIANSVDTAVGYAGIGLALLLALSYAGLDITSLALVAGALSVGIGFGLQSIVNNFVSGLILLVERPIKVGDWIVVGDQQGNVRRISVRSTEIETFDKASLIIPNSELITGKVLNWTHRNPLGRAVVKVDVLPTADPELVLKILNESAVEQHGTLAGQKPFVTFDGFSATALTFTVRALVADVYQSSNVATNLRVAILKRLKAENILMPATPQYDIRLSDLEWIKATAAQIAQQRRGTPAPSGEAPAAPPAGAQTQPPSGSNDNT